MTVPMELHQSYLDEVHRQLSAVRPDQPTQLGRMLGDWVNGDSSELEPGQCACDKAALQVSLLTKKVACVEPATAADGLCDRCRIECDQEREA